MVKPDRHRAEKSVEIDESLVRDGVVQIRAATFVEIDNDLEAVEQDVLLDRLKNFGRRDLFLSFALCGSVPM